MVQALQKFMSNRGSSSGLLATGALQNLQSNRGSSSGLLATGATPAAPAAASAADQQAMFINQPTFNPADLHRRFPDEEKAGTSDSYGFQQGYDVYGSDDEA